MKSPAVLALLLASGIASAAQSPSEAAVDWLREVASGKAESSLSNDTALSPDTSEDDLKMIRARLSRLRESLRANDLKAVADKEDGDLAAVLVSQITNFDANSVQIHAVGLVKSEDKWLPAPLPSSFNGTGLSFRPGFLQRAKGLEDWMLRTRSAQLVRLKDDAFSLLFDEMRKVKSPEDLHHVTPEKLALDFLAALKARDLPAALAMAGGLETPRPPDWDETFQVLSRTLGKKEIAHPEWRLLAATEAVRAIVDADEDGGIVSVVALDPGGNLEMRPRPRAVHLSFVRSKAGSWRVRLPHELLTPVTQKNSPGREMEEDPVDADLIARFPEKLRAALGSKREPSSRAASEALVAALRAPSFEALCARLDLSAKPEVALDTLGRAAPLWQHIHRPVEAATPILLDVHEFGDDACALVQVFSARDPAKASIERLFLHHTQDGWLANAGFSGAAGLSFAGEKEAIEQWSGPVLKAREADWSAGILTRIGGIAADSAPTEEEARRVVGDWRAAVAAGDGEHMLALSACFDDLVGSTRLLRSTGYELSSRQPGEILGVQRSGRWAAVSLRVPPADGDDSADSFPLVVVVATAVGPRILPEIDLFYPLTRGREALNRSVWGRVAARLPDGARGELESIYEKHRTISAAARERRPKPTE